MKGNSYKPTMHTYVCIHILQKLATFSLKFQNFFLLPPLFCLSTPQEMIKKKTRLKKENGNKKWGIQA